MALLFIFVLQHVEPSVILSLEIGTNQLAGNCYEAEDSMAMAMSIFVLCPWQNKNLTLELNKRSSISRRVRQGNVSLLVIFLSNSHFDHCNSQF